MELQMENMKRQTMSLGNQKREVTIRLSHKIRPRKVQKFTDRWIGEDYYALKSLKCFPPKRIGGLNSSFIAFSKDKVVGVRLTYAPGTWVESSADYFKTGLSFQDWKIPPEKMGYFKSLFIHEDYQGAGLGKTLSHKALSVLKEMGAHAVLCHSWMESPKIAHKDTFNDFKKIKERLIFGMKLIILPSLWTRRCAGW